MTISVDANTTNSAGTGSADFTHTATSSTTNPVKGILVIFLAEGTTTSEITSCSYASNALTFITRAEVGGGGGDQGGYVDIYFRGDQYTPGGTQTVSFTRSGTASDVNVAVYSLLGTGNLEVQTSNTQSGTITDPTLLMEVSSANCMSFYGLYSGQATIASVTDGSGITRYDEMDLGNQVVFSGRQTTQSTSDFTFSFTIGSDEVALAGVAIKENPIQIYTKASGTWYPADLSVYAGDPAVNYPANPYVLLGGRWIS